jgi:hypothetical protein
MSTAGLPENLPAYSRPVPVVAVPDAGGGDRGGRRLLLSAFSSWLPIAAVVVVMTGVIYVTVQQSIRAGADDPQLQIAGDLAAQLGGGAAPAPLLGAAKVDLAVSLAPYAIVFDQSGAVLASTAVLDGATPEPPAGVLRAARNHRNDLTWQPKGGVRSAIVVQPWRSATGNGTVLVGRSLTEVEKRESVLLWLTAAGTAGGLGVTAAACMAAAWLRRRLG